MNDYTPGPWEAVELNPDGAIIRQSGYEIRTPEYDVVAHMTHRPPIRREADARLISAAPELLEACEKLVSAMVRYQMIVEGEAPRSHIEMMQRARAAIAKAKGEA